MHPNRPRPRLLAWALAAFSRGGDRPPAQERPGAAGAAGTPGFVLDAPDPAPGSLRRGRRRPLLRRPRWLARLGPGLITGAADDDPSGIATYSQAGAAFGYTMLWTLPLAFPLLVAMQTIAARIGRATGRGIAANLRASYPPRAVEEMVALLAVDNTSNNAADLAAIADAQKLVAGGPSQVYAVAFGVFTLLLQVFASYRRYVRVLKWLTVSLLAYAGVLMVVHVPWGTVAGSLAVPAWRWDREYAQMVAAILGTTISPYLFFWQAAQESENARGEGLRPGTRRARVELARIRLDTVLGMAFSCLIALCIMVAAAATLHAAGATELGSSAAAAAALRPVAGPLAFALFAAGIIGTGLLAVPVLAGSVAYAVAESRAWRAGLRFKLREARGFYGVLGAALLGGVALDFADVNPIKALVWSAVVNAVVSVPIMIVVMRLASDRAVMGAFAISPRLRVVGWLATAAMAAAVACSAALALAG